MDDAIKLQKNNYNVDWQPVDCIEFDRLLQFRQQPVRLLQIWQPGVRNGCAPTYSCRSQFFALQRELFILIISQDPILERGGNDFLEFLMIYGLNF